MYKMYFNKKSNEDLNFSIIKRPSIGMAERNYTGIDIKGHDGKLYKSENLNDLEITIECNFINVNITEWHEQYRIIRSWLNNVKDNKLQLEDNAEWYYVVKKIQLDSFDRIYKVYGKFNLKFTVAPYMYYKNNNEIKLPNMINNAYDIAQPVYRIVGNGNCTLNINGNPIDCNVNGQMTIDIAHDKILEADNTYSIGKTNIGDMSLLYLQNGINTFSYTSGFTVYITRNFRSI